MRTAISGSGVHPCCSRGLNMGAWTWGNEYGCYIQGVNIGVHSEGVNMGSEYGGLHQGGASSGWIFGEVNMGGCIQGVNMGRCILDAPRAPPLCTEWHAPVKTLPSLLCYATQSNITSFYRTFSWPIICTDTYSQCYFDITMPHTIKFIG